MALGAPLAADSVPAAASELLPVRAWLLGERLDTRGLERQDPLGTAPLTVRLGERGVAVLFRYGVVVLFDAAPAVETAFLAKLAPLVIEPLPARETEAASLRVAQGAEEQVELSGTIVLREASTERLQMVADALAKSLVLSHYEMHIAGIFDRIDPLAATLRAKGRTGATGSELLRHIGDVLTVQHKMVGRVETGEKPELLWEHPELERLYLRLAEEYEMRERDRALDRKLEVISRTVEMLLGLVQSRSSMRVEWYIVALIVAELLLSLYHLVPWPLPSWPLLSWPPGSAG